MMIIQQSQSIKQSTSASFKQQQQFKQQFAQNFFAFSSNIIFAFFAFSTINVFTFFAFDDFDVNNIFTSTFTEFSRFVNESQHTLKRHSEFCIARKSSLNFLIELIALFLLIQIFLIESYESKIYKNAMTNAQRKMN